MLNFRNPGVIRNRFPVLGGFTRFMLRPSEMSFDHVILHMKIIIRNYRQPVLFIYFLCVHESYKDILMN